MRYEGDINTAQQVEINRPRGSGSVDKAPDSELYRHGFESTGEQQFLLITTIINH